MLDLFYIFKNEIHFRVEHFMGILERNIRAFLSFFPLKIVTPMLCSQIFDSHKHSSLQLPSYSGRFESLLELPDDDEGFWNPWPVQKQRGREQEAMTLPQGAEKKAEEKKCLFFLSHVFSLKNNFLFKSSSIFSQMFLQLSIWLVKTQMKEINMIVLIVGSLNSNKI